MTTAAAAFETHGYHGASVDLIARQAGYTKGAAYGHFATKDDLFLAVYDSRTAERAELVAGLARTDLEPGERLRVVVASYTRLVAANRPWTIALLEFTAHAARRPQLLTRLAEREQALRLALAEAVAPLARHAGVDASTYAEAALLVVNGIVLEQAHDPLRPAPELAALVAAAVHRGLARELHDA